MRAAVHALTVTCGRAIIAAGDERMALSPFETVLVPAERGAYRLEAEAPFTALLARLP